MMLKWGLPVSEIIDQKNMKLLTNSHREHDFVSTV